VKFKVAENSFGNLLLGIYAENKSPYNESQNPLDSGSSDLSKQQNRSIGLKSKRQKITL